MPRVFIYVNHRNGVPDDTWGELAAAAARITGESPVAVVTGWGESLDGVSNALRMQFPETWSIAGETLAHPNAEVVRIALIRALPRKCVLLLAHDHFGVDLSPGLSIRM